MNLPQNVIINRALLKNIMERYGFIALGTEWWHYDFDGYKNYEIMDISFRELVK
jgi:D-alanyl-D-alanine dipeptidase